jgi:hypothetical protein
MNTVKQPYTNENEYVLPLLIFSALCSILFPWLGTLIGILIIVSSRGIRHSYFTYLIFIIVLPFAYMNYTKNAESDLRSYYLIYGMLDNASISDYLSIFNRIMTTDYFYYLVSLIIVKLTSNNNLVTLFWTITMYMFLGLALLNIFNLLKIKKPAYFALALIVTIFVYFPFTSTGHLVRQFVAMPIIVYGITRKLMGKQYLAYFLLSAFIHTSSLVLIIPIYIFNSRYRWSVLILISFLMLFVSQFNIKILSVILGGNSIILNKMHEYQFLHGVEYSFNKMWELMIFTIAALFIYYKNRNSNDPIKILMYVFMFMTIFMFSFKDYGQAFIRYGYYVRLFYSIIILYALNYSNIYFRTIVILYVLISPIRFNNAVFNSEWTYISNEKIIKITTLDIIRTNPFK